MNRKQSTAQFGQLGPLEEGESVGVAAGALAVVVGAGVAATTGAGAGAEGDDRSFVQRLQARAEASFS